jgi:hypothetical protein
MLDEPVNPLVVPEEVSHLVLLDRSEPFLRALTD